MFVQRITISQIKSHPWFLKNLPMEFVEGASYEGSDSNSPWQSVEEVVRLIQEARHIVEVPNDKLGVGIGGLIGTESSMDLDDVDIDDADIEDLETIGDFVCPSYN